MTLEQKIKALKGGRNVASEEWDALPAEEKEGQTAPEFPSVEAQLEQAQQHLCFLFDVHCNPSLSCLHSDKVLPAISRMMSSATYGHNRLRSCPCVYFCAKIVKILSYL